MPQDKAQDYIRKPLTEISAREDAAERMREILGQHDVVKPDELHAAVDQLWENVVNLFLIEHRAQKIESDSSHSRWLIELFGERLMTLFAAPAGETETSQERGGQVAPDERFERSIAPAPPAFEMARRETPVEASAKQNALVDGALKEHRKKEETETPSYAPLEGDRARVALQTLARVRQLYNVPGELMTFLAQAVAPALDRLETNRQATPEELVDIVVGPLAGRRFPGTPLGDWRGIARLVAGLRGFLEKQESKDRGEGYYKTRGALPQWLQKIDDLEGGDPECRRLIVFYYHELLSLGPDGVKDAGLFGMLANNLGGILSEMWRDRPDDKQGRLLSRIQALATAARLRGQANERDAIGMAGWLFQVLGMPFGDGRAFGMADALMMVANIPPAWREVDALVLAGSGQSVGAPRRHGEDWMALMSCAAGIVRMAYNERDDWDEIPSSLFNTGVALARSRRAAGNGKQAIVAAQVAFNAVGLTWALAHGQDWREALDDFHGIDCAVNMFGALTEWRPEHGDVAQAVMGRLAGGLVAGGAALDAARQVEYVRLRASWQKLGIKVGSAGQAQAALLDVLDTLMLALKIDLPGHAGLKGGDDARRAWMADTARVLAGQLKATFGDAMYGELAADLSTLLDAMLGWSDNIENAWRKLYGDIAESTLDAAGNPGPDHSGPLVKLGEMERAEWIDLANRAIDANWSVPLGSSPAGMSRLGPWLAKLLGSSNPERSS